MSQLENEFPKPKKPDYETQITHWSREMIVWNYRRQGWLEALKYYVEQHACNGFTNCNYNHVPCQTIEAMKKEIAELEKEK